MNCLLANSIPHPSIHEELYSRVNQGVLIFHFCHMSEGTDNAQVMISCFSNGNICLLICCCFLYLSELKEINIFNIYKFNQEVLMWIRKLIPHVYAHFHQLFPECVIANIFNSDRGCPQICWYSLSEKKCGPTLPWTTQTEIILATHIYSFVSKLQ